jgi:hypothetical protein
MWAGFCSVDVALSPKDHAHDVGVPDDESINCTESGAVPVVVAATNKPVGVVAWTGIDMVRVIVVTRRIARKSILMVHHSGIVSSQFGSVLVPAWFHLT